MSIFHFRKQFAAPPVVVEVPGICVRAFVAPDDIAPWLALRNRATAELAPPVRPWSVDDFDREMRAKPWWRADRSWVAVAGDLRVAGPRLLRPRSDERSSPAIDACESRSIVGAVTLALREGSEATVPVVHWLLVDPSWQRRGVACALMSYLELAGWNSGYREVQLETHANWHAAVALYQSIGYVPLRARSPR